MDRDNLKYAWCSVSLAVCCNDAEVRDLGSLLFFTLAKRAHHLEEFDKTGFRGFLANGIRRSSGAVPPPSLASRDAVLGCFAPGIPFEDQGEGFEKINEATLVCAQAKSKKLRRASGVL